MGQPATQASTRKGQIQLERETTTDQPGRSQSDAASAFEVLLGVEDRVRAAADENELVHLLANETRKLVAARQIVVVRALHSGKFQVMAISSLAVTDRDTPFVRWVEGMIAAIKADAGVEQAIDYELPAFTSADVIETQSYPFGHFLWQPLSLRSGDVFAGLLLARERPWSEADKQLMGREARVFATIWQSLAGTHKLGQSKRWGSWRRLVIGGALALAACIPVPMTTLAPVELVAANPHRITAPIDGVVKEIFVDPNQPVKAGQPVLAFEDTVLRNQYRLAERALQVANARYARLQRAAFSDTEARHDLTIALNEMRVKRAERDFAANQLERTKLTADRDGVLIYANRDTLVGRPVRTGERLMQIANPSDIAARIELPVADAIVLERGSNVKLFLDSDPLNSVRATLKNKSYHATANSTQQLVYNLDARLDKTRSDMRIGARGTAQLFGDYVPLIYFLLRRPIAAMRQYVGI